MHENGQGLTLAANSHVDSSDGQEFAGPFVHGVLDPVALYVSTLHLFSTGPLHSLWPSDDAYMQSTRVLPAADLQLTCSYLALESQCDH